MKGQAKLDRLCRQYIEWREEAKAVKAAMDLSKPAILAVLEAANVEAAEGNGWAVKLVRSTSRRLDKAKLLEAGVTTEQLEAGTVESVSVYPNVRAVE